MTLPSTPPAPIARHDADTAPPPTRRLTGDAGEGVISAAIAVLVMALLGAAMWVAFNRIWTDAADRTEQKVSQISD